MRVLEADWVRTRPLWSSRSSCWGSGAASRWCWTSLTPSSRGSTGAPRCCTEQRWPSSWLSGRTVGIAPSQCYAPSKSFHPQHEGFHGDETFSLMMISLPDGFQRQILGKPDHSSVWSPRTTFRHHRGTFLLYVIITDVGPKSVFNQDYKSHRDREI